MSHLKSIATLAVLVSLVFAAPALAARHHHHHKARPHPKSNPITLAQARAVEYWGEAPCGGHLTIATETPSPQMIEGLVSLYGPAGQWPLSWSSWDSPTGEDAKTSPPSTYTDCHVGLNMAFWPSLAYDRAHFEELCQAVTHEYGNLWGLPETEDTESVMDRQGGSVPGPCYVSE